MNFENLSKNRISFEIKNNKIGAINRVSLKLLIKKRRDKSRLYIFDITYLHIASILPTHFKQRIGNLS